MAIPGIDDTTGNWVASSFEAPSSSKNGMMYRATANISLRTKELGDNLNNVISSPNLEVDNPLILGQITALSGSYNMARQLQSNIMKAIKDTAQAIIRNV